MRIRVTGLDPHEMTPENRELYAGEIAHEGAGKADYHAENLEFVRENFPTLAIDESAGGPHSFDVVADPAVELQVSELLDLEDYMTTHFYGTRVERVP